MLLCFIFFGILSSCNSKESQEDDLFADDLWLSEAYVEATVLQNGSLSVKETWTVETSSEDGYRNIYRTIDTNDSVFNTASDFTFDGIINNSTGKDFPLEKEIKQMQLNSAYEYNTTHYVNSSYAITTDENKYEIGVIIPKLCKGEKLSLTFNYTLSNFVRAYADTAEFFWIGYSSDFIPIKKLEIKLTMPSNVDYANQEQSLIWYHGQKDGKITFEKNVAFLTIQKTEPNASVEIRSIVPRSSFSSLAKVSTSEVKNTIIEQERVWFETNNQ